MAEALPDLELSRLAVRDDDDEVCLMLRKMPYEELTGRRGGVFYHTQDDGHLYRFNKPIKSDPNKIGVYCYHIKITKDATVREKCKAYGVIDQGILLCYQLADNESMSCLQLAVN